MAAMANGQTQNTMSQIPHTDSDSGPTPLGLFAKLPQEIRDMIYEPVLSAGHTSITRTSKALHKNTKLALDQHGILRVRIVHYCANTFALYPQIQIGHFPDIRNLNVSFRRTRYGEQASGPEWKKEILAHIVLGLMFSIRDPTRCILKLDMSASGFIDQQHITAFSSLRAFKKVNVVVCLLSIFLLLCSVTGFYHVTRKPSLAMGSPRKYITNVGAILS